MPDLSATIDERRTAGKSGRSRAPRRALGDWSQPERGHDALATILAQNRLRVPELVPIRHHRMAASPWTYYRGAAAVMAADLAARPHTGIEVQLCGDAHVLNFGLWATPERNLLFDLRDFDETLPGPFEWDVKRLAASLVIVAREHGLTSARAEAAVAAAVEEYRRRIHEYTTMPELDTWYDGVHVDDLVDYFDPADRGQVTVRIEKKQQTRTSRGAFGKLTDMIDGRPRITEDPPMRVALSDDEQADLVDRLLAQYRLTLPDDRRFLFDRFVEVDMVRQVVGVGSVGMRVYLVLLEGRTGIDPLFLQVKQAGASVYEKHLRASRHASHGERVVAGKRRIQTATDIFVGWGSLHGRDYLRAAVPRHEDHPQYREDRTTARRVRRRLRPDAGPGARADRRRGGHRRLHRTELSVHRCDRRFRPPVRRPERARPQSTRPRYRNRRRRKPRRLRRSSAALGWVDAQPDPRRSDRPCRRHHG